MGPLSLLVDFLGVTQAFRTYLSAGRQQLAVPENRSERIIQLVRDSGHELPDRCQFFAVHQLLRRPSQILISAACLLVQEAALDRAADLASDRDQKADIRRR